MSTYPELPLQAGSLEIWNTKYRLKTKKGEPIDKDVAATQDRLAKALSKIEAAYKRGEAYKKFLWVLQHGAVPAGRIVSNAGAGTHKSNTSLINCFAGDTPVLTDKGIFPIKQLSDSQMPVNVLNRNGNWSTVIFKHHGVQPVYELLFKYCKDKLPVGVKVTAGHRWILTSGTIITTEFWLTTPPDALGDTTKLPHIPAPGANCESTIWELVAIDYTSKLEQVYCCEEPETNSFCILNGLLTGNCTVSMSITDSMPGILKSAYEAGITLASGAGIGYEFSTIRNNGAFISGVGASTSGALSFMDIHDAVCFTVSSAGGRRGK